MTTSNMNAFRIEHPELVFEIQNIQVENELIWRLCLESSMVVSGKEVEVVFNLTHGYELVVRPMVRSYGGYPVWGRVTSYFAEEKNDEVRLFRYHVHSTLRIAGSENPEFEFELQASSLERVVNKSLEHIKHVHKKRFAAIPVLTIN